MQSFDIALVGTSLQTAMIAGLLARDHKKNVCVFINKSMLHQVAREISFSFDFITRPQTWELLEASVREALPIISKVGGGNATNRANPLVVCHRQKTADALAHMYHLLRGADCEIERLSPEKFPHTKAAYRLRGIRVIEPSVMWPAFFNWLNTVGVKIFTPEQLQISALSGTSATLKTRDIELHTSRLVLADEKAIHAYANIDDINQLFIQCSTSALITEPANNLREQLVINPENMFSARTTKNGVLEVLANVELDEIASQIGINISGNYKFRRAGHTSFPSILTRDGAPVAGKMKHSKVWGLAGFGHAGVFFSPALARLICDKSTNTETAYFASRKANKARNNKNISDIACIENGHP